MKCNLGDEGSVVVHDRKKIFAQGSCNISDMHPERVKRYDMEETRGFASAMHQSVPAK